MADLSLAMDLRNLAEQARHRAFTNDGIASLGRAMLLSDARTLLQLAGEVNDSHPIALIDALKRTKLCSVQLNERVVALAMASIKSDAGKARY
jgi:hypothetical protein